MRVCHAFSNNKSFSVRKKEVKMLKMVLKCNTWFLKGAHHTNRKRKIFVNDEAINANASPSGVNKLYYKSWDTF